ncbi:MAG: glycosyltransferase family 2 protein, partial [Acidimicrobiales bacterium]
MDPEAVDPLATAEDVDSAAPEAETQPAVVAVVVTHDAGAWFEETLASLRDQTYRSLSVLVIDAASAEDPTPRIAAILPTAYVRRLDANPGFGAAANELLGSVEGAAFYLLCHDDVALHSDAVRTLVEEAFRSNAGIAGPKLVDWDRPAQLRQVGASVDKTGVAAPFAEPGELDQEQHDAVRDVFFVPGGCTLVRADLFEALGGFDPGIDFLGEDLDLCWRSHVVGARVLIVPAAAVRHLEALGLRRGGEDDRRRLQARHRLRSVLSCYRPFHLARVLPQAIFFTVVEALYALAAGRPGQTRDVLSAWTWNLRRPLQIRAKRRAIRRVRTVPDSDVRALQVRGSARLTAFIRGQIGGGEDRLVGVTEAGRNFAETLRARSNRAALLLGAAVIGLVLLGSRNLLFGAIPAVGEFAAFPDDPSTLIRGWTSGWWSAGLGSDRAAPTALGLLGGAGTLLFGATGLLRTVLILALVPIGLVGIWRLARPVGSLRAGVAALVVYAAIP